MVACGDCFRWASKRALKAFGSGEDLVMVHATVQPKYGMTLQHEPYLNKKRFPHAWVEYRGKVMESYALPASPVWDGLAVAGCRLYIAMEDGTVQCMKPTSDLR